MNFANLFKWFGTLLPLVAQGVLQIQSNAGVTHQTVIGNIAMWVLAGGLSKAFHASHSDPQSDQGANPGT